MEKKFTIQVNPEVSYEVTFIMESKDAPTDRIDVTTIRNPYDESLTFEQFCKETAGIDYKELLRQCRQ